LLFLLFLGTSVHLKPPNVFHIYSL
jgi:hypothetical protein